MASPTDAVSIEKPIKVDYPPASGLSRVFRCAEIARGLQGLCEQPKHMRTRWPFFLIFLCFFNAALFAWVGLGVFEQQFLVRDYNILLADTAWPPIVAGIAGSCSFILAGVSDRFNFFGLGHRLPFIALGQGLTTAGFLAVAWVPPTPGGGWANYLAMTVFRAFSMNLANSALAGLIIDADIRDKIGIVQATRAVGTMTGLLMVTQGGAQIAQAYGLLVYCMFLAACVAPIFVLPMSLAGLLREEKAEVVVRKSEPFDWASLKILWRVDTIAVIILTVTGLMGNVVGNFLLNQFLFVQKNLSIVDIGHLGTVSAVVNLPGSFLAAYALDHWDVRWLIFIVNAITGLTTLAVIWTPYDLAFEYNVGLNLVGSLTGQCAQTAIAGVALRLAPIKLGASFMAIIGGITSVMGIIGNVIGGQLATVENNFVIGFISGSVILFAGCAAVPFLGATAQVPKKAGANPADASTTDAALPNPYAKGAAADADAVRVANPLAALAAGGTEMVRVAATSQRRAAGDTEAPALPAAEVPGTVPTEGVSDWAAAKRH